MTAQLAADIATASWQATSSLDRERDMKVLLQKMDGIIEHDDKMFQALASDNQDLRELIKTMQRSLQALETRHLENSEPSPYSHGPIVLASSAFHARSRMVRTASPLPSDSAIVRTLEISPSQRKWPTRGNTRSSWQGTLEVPLPDTHDSDVEDHIHFLKRGLEVLLSRTGGTSGNLPDWTITSFEITNEERVASGFYSTVFKASWKRHLVAVKRLKEEVNHDLFLREVEIWRSLDHPNILQLWGASSTTGSPPWHFVSPWCERGHVLQWLRSVEGSTANRLELTYGIASGLEHLHGRDVVHGDIKCANILIADSGLPKVCDFGLADLKSNIDSRSHGTLEHGMAGTFRFMAPELWQTQHNGAVRSERKTFASDVYAFAITVAELYTLETPYGHADDETVLRAAILNRHQPRRPSLPAKILPQVKAIVERSWSYTASERPSFAAIVEVLRPLLNPDLIEIEDHWSSSSVTSASYMSASTSSSDIPEEQIAVTGGPRAKSLLAEHMNGLEVEQQWPIEGILDADWLLGANESCPIYAAMYRQTLIPSDAIPAKDLFRLRLWQPAPVELADVGFATATGAFIKLFNAVAGPSSTELILPHRCMQPFIDTDIERHTIETRSAAALMAESVTTAMSKFLFRSGDAKSKAISRRIAFPLFDKGTDLDAQLVFDGGNTELFRPNTVEVAREWLSTNVDAIVAGFPDLELRRTDIMIIIGAMKAKDWAVMIAGSEFQSTVSFNVHAVREQGSPWGTWSVAPGPTEGKEVVDKADLQLKCKTSLTCDSQDALLLSRLKIPEGSEVDRPVKW